MKQGKSTRTTKRSLRKRYCDNIPSIPTLTRYPTRSPWVARAEACTTYSMAPKPRTVFKSTAKPAPAKCFMWGLGAATPNKSSK